jgi:phage terminase small subunit
MDRAMQQLSSTKRVKAGNGQAAAAARRNVFVQAFLANGHNATRAAITAGYSAKTAYSQGQRLLKHVEISGQLADVAQKVAEIAGLTAECTLRETARISYFDPRRLFHSDGSLKQITEMDDDTRAGIASFEIDERKVDGVVVGRTTKIKLWDKNRALEMAMRHLGLYERHNTQQSENLSLQVLLVGAPTNERE